MELYAADASQIDAAAAAAAAADYDDVAVLRIVELVRTLLFLDAHALSYIYDSETIFSLAWDLDL